VRAVLTEIRERTAQKGEERRRQGKEDGPGGKELRCGRREICSWRQFAKESDRNPRRGEIESALLGGQRAPKTSISPRAAKLTLKDRRGVPLVTGQSMTLS